MTNHQTEYITVTVETNKENTMETLLYYVLPNVVLFGGIYVIAKLLERYSWYVITNYDRLVDKLTKQ